MRSDAGLQLEHTEKQDQMDVLQQRIGTNLREELEGIIDSVCAWIFLQILMGSVRIGFTFSVIVSHLIKRADRSHKYDCISVVKVRDPGVTLSTGTPHIVQVP